MGENNMSINLINYALAKKDWKKAYEDLKVLEIGGRNLLPNSDFSQGIKHWGVSGSTYTISGNEITVTSDDNGGWPRLYVISDTIKSIKKGEVYTLSFEAKGHNSNPRTWRISESTGSNIVYSSPDITYTNKWERYVYTFTAERDANEHTRLEFWIDGHQTPGRNSRSYRNIKLEKGNKATDWTPAPEDIDAHPFVAELAETVFRSKQNEERIRNLENAITALGLEEKSISN